MYEEAITEAISDYKADEHSIQQLSEKIEDYAYALLKANDFTPEPYESMYIVQRVVRKIKNNSFESRYETGSIQWMITYRWWRRMMERRVGFDLSVINL